jgi:hypothetical protein
MSSGNVVEAAERCEADAGATIGIRRQRMDWGATAGKTGLRLIRAAINRPRFVWMPTCVRDYCRTDSRRIARVGGRQQRQRARQLQGIASQKNGVPAGGSFAGVDETALLCPLGMASLCNVQMPHLNLWRCTALATWLLPRRCGACLAGLHMAGGAHYRSTHDEALQERSPAQVHAHAHARPQDGHGQVNAAGADMREYGT